MERTAGREGFENLDEKTPRPHDGTVPGASGKTQKY